MKNQNGFTMIELVVVMVILGILAAVAVPKFLDLRSDARSASIRGVAGGLRAAGALARAQYKINDNNVATTVVMDGTTVTVIAGAANGYPAASANGITAAMESIDGFTPSYDAATGTATFTPTGYTGTNCEAVYDEANGSVTVTVTGC